jgi:3-methyladenine DNA glycosylase AlkD
MIPAEEESNPELLFHSCEVLAHEQEFFIRKAIGWALRSYARIDGTAVVDYCNSMGDRLSPLSRKEALKHASTPGRNFKIQ